MGFTALTLPSANRIVKLFHLGGVLFAVCDNGSDDVVYASSDGGATWAGCGDLGLFPSGYRVRRISEGNGTFFICRDGLAAYSAAPTSGWALVDTSPASDDAYDVAYFNSFYWMGNSDGGTVYKSASPGGGYSAAYTSIGYGHEVLAVAGGRLFASSLDFGGASAGVVSTADGTTWSVETTDGINRFLISDGTDVFAVEDLGNGKARKFVTPGTWTAAVEAPDVTYPFWAFVQAGNLVSWAYPPGARDVFDGSAWASATETPPASYTSINAATFDGTTEFVSFWDSVGSTSALYAFTGGGGGGPTGEVISLPLVLHVTPAGESISLPLRLHVREAQSVSLPLVLHVIDAAATGGLDGAGGWPMAPDGRWICLATLAGDDISLRLLAEVDVRCVWDGARTAQFHFKPVGALAPMGLLKQRVTLAAAQRGAAGVAINPQPIFAGVVQRVEVDWRTGIITCLCWDQFQEVLAATPQEWFAAEIGGRYFKEVSGQAEDNFEYAMARLKSVPKSIALDVMQRPVVLPWHAPARAVTVRTEDLSDAEISVRLPEASNLRTRIRVNAEYAFQVLRNRGFVTQWQRDVRWFINGPNGIGVPIKFLTKTMIEGAISDLSGWELQGDIAITHPRPGLYDTEVAIYPSGYIITPEAAQELALGWRAFLSTRWVQHRTWRYTLDVVATNLEALLGKAVPEERGFTLRAPEVSATWETDDTSKPRFGLAAGHIPYARVGDTVVNFPEAEEAPEGYTPEDFEEAARTALDIAWVELDGQAMSGEVEFAMFCRPDMWLDTQVTLISEGKTVEGPVKQVRHVLNADTGDADTIVTLAVGLPGAPAPYVAPTWTLPARPNPEAVVAAAGGLPPGGVSGRSSYYIGGLASSQLFNPETMIGFITNVDDPTMAQATAEGRNWYPYQLTIGAPDILASDRDPMDLPADATFEMDLPTFTLEII